MKLFSSRWRVTAGCLMGFVLTVAAGCASVATERPVEQEESSLERGRRLYQQSCRTCHPLYEPEENTRREWTRAVKRYGPRSGLSRDKRELVLEYLHAHAWDAPVVEGDAAR